MAQEDLFNALKMFSQGVKEQQTTQSLLQASEYANQIRRSQLDEAGKRDQLRQVADQLTLALSGQGKTPDEIKQVGNAISPGLAYEADLAKIAAQGQNQLRLKAVDVAQNQSEKAVPGLGTATQKGIAKDLIEANASVQTAAAGIDELMNISKINAKSVSPTVRARAQTTAKMLQGALRKEIIGPGTVTDRDQALLDSIVADPTKLFTLDPSSREALTTLKQRVNVGFGKKLQAAGITPPPSAQPTSATGSSPDLSRYLIKRK